MEKSSRKKEKRSDVGMFEGLLLNQPLTKVTAAALDSQKCKAEQVMTVTRELFRGAQYKLLLQAGWGNEN